MSDAIGPGAPAMLRHKPLLITGGAGFIGANLADRLAAEGHDVLVLDSLVRPGVERNLEWLRRRHPRRISAALSDIRDASAVQQAVFECSAVFHLAAQVAVTSSMADPAEDHEVNLHGTFLLLEAVRRRMQPVPVIFASTNKVYGTLEDVPLTLADQAWRPTGDALCANGVNESRRLDFHTPYGCSKGAADQYVLDWARSFGVPSAVFRMSCIYGPRQMGSEDQGWVAHFLIRALRGEPITIFGDGFQVRDVLFVDDAVAAYVAAWKRIGAVAGQAFNLGGGPANAVSLRQVLDWIGVVTGSAPELRHQPWRPGDQRWYVSDPRRATAALGLSPPRPWRQGIEALAGWLATEHGAAMPAPARARASA